ncbi:MAG: glycosyltransferase [Candidatus Magasanikbacteria bacterium]
MKHIIIFSTAYDPFLGGAEVAVKEITDRIGDIEFHMVTAKMDRKLLKKENIGNITVHRVGIGVPMIDKLFLAMFGHRKGIALNSEIHFDLCWSIMASYSGFAARLFKKKTGIPFLLTLQEGDPFDYIQKKVRFVRKKFEGIFSSADGLQAISTYLLNWGKNMGFQGEISKVIPNGVDIGKFKIQNSKFQIEAREEIRNKCSIPENGKILVTVSRLVKKNGVGDLIEAMKRLGDTVHLLVIGTGELESDLRAFSKELGLEDRVHFSGRIEHQDLPKYLWASNIFCRPSLSEGLGNVFLEAMAAGLPVIGTMVGGIPDFLEDEKTGFVCNPEDVESITRAVEKVLGLSEEDLDVILKRTQSLVQEKFNWDTIAVDMRNMMIVL